MRAGKNIKHGAVSETARRAAPHFPPSDAAETQHPDPSVYASPSQTARPPANVSGSSALVAGGASPSIVSPSGKPPLAASPPSTQRPSAAALVTTRQVHQHQHQCSAVSTPSASQLLPLVPVSATPASSGRNTPSASWATAAPLAAAHGDGDGGTSSTSSNHCGGKPRFGLPPPLPPMPQMPVQSSALVTVEQARIRSAIQSGCIALIQNMQSHHATAPTSTPTPRPPAPTLQQQHHHEQPQLPTLQVALFENDRCTWRFGLPGGGGGSSSIHAFGAESSAVADTSGTSAVTYTDSHGGGRSGTTPTLMMPMSAAAAAAAASAGGGDAALFASPLQQSQQQQGGSSSRLLAGGVGTTAATSATTTPPTPGACALSLATTTGRSAASGGGSGTQLLRHHHAGAADHTNTNNHNNDFASDAQVARVADALTAEFVLPTGERASDDVRQFRRRVRAAFAQQAKVYQHELRARDDAAAQLRAALARHEAGGDIHAEWRQRLEDAERTVAKQDDRIKSLVKLLERTGVAMKKFEKRLAESATVTTTTANNRVPQSQLLQRQTMMFASLAGSFNMSSVGAASNALAGSASPLAHTRSTMRRTIAEMSIDWNPLYQSVPELLPENHDNTTIVRDIAELVTNLRDHAADLEAQYDTVVERFTARDRECAAIKLDVENLTAKLEQADKLMDHMLLDIRKLQSDREAADLAASTTKRSLEFEKEGLQRRVIELEGTMAKSVEAKPFFVGLGRSLVVLPFLRYEGRVKNLDLPKADVEAIINRIWAKRDPGRYSIRRAQNAVAQYLNAAYPGHAVIEPPTISPSELDEIHELVDYDNVKFVRRTGTNFIDFVTELLLEKSAALLYGGHAFDFDSPVRVAGVPAAAVSSAAVAGGLSSSLQAGAAAADAVNRANKGKRRSRTKSQVLRKGDQLRNNPNMDWRNNPHFSVSQAVAEIAYSLMEGCERYKYDADIELFRAIIREEVSELAWFDQMIMLAKLKAAMLQQGRMRSGRAGTATVAVILQTLYAFFPCKDRESFDFLRNALLMEARAVTAKAGAQGGAITAAARSSSRVGPSASTSRHPLDADEPSEEDLLQVALSVHALFESNEFGNQGPFAEGVRDQHLEEACMYSAELSTAASMCADPGTGRATIADLRAVFVDVDPTKPREEVDQFIGRVVAILLDEDGVDPFELPQSSLAPSVSAGAYAGGGGGGGGAGGSSSSRLSSRRGSAVQASPTIVLPTPCERNEMAHPASLPRAASGFGFLSVAGQHGASTASMGSAASSNLSRAPSFRKDATTGFRAQELMIMLEEGRRLKTVSDTDLVDCERFAAACRSVFSKRFGMRLQENADGTKFGEVRAPAVVAGLWESHEMTASTWRNSVGRRESTTVVRVIAPTSPTEPHLAGPEFQSAHPLDSDYNFDGTGGLVPLVAVEGEDTFLDDD